MVEGAQESSLENAKRHNKGGIERVKARETSSIMRLAIISRLEAEVGEGVGAAGNMLQMSGHEDVREKTIRVEDYPTSVEFIGEFPQILHRIMNFGEGKGRIHWGVILRIYCFRGKRNGGRQ